MMVAGPITIDNVYLATKAASVCADKIGAKSVAMSGMDTGVGGVSLREGAETMIRAIKEYVASGAKLKTIALVAINDDLVEQFMVVLKAV